MYLIEIKDIGPAGIHLSRALKSQEIERLLPGTTVADPSAGESYADINLNVTRSAANVFVQGKVGGSLVVGCSRCLGPARVELPDDELRVTFLPPPAVTEDELALVADDLDTYTHDGKVIDLEAFVREQLLLGVPIAPVCRADCRGICAHCGADLNRVTCQCAGAAKADSSELKPTWTEALKKIKVNS